MLLARLCRSGISPQVSSFLKAPVVPRSLIRPFNAKSSNREGIFSRIRTEQKFKAGKYRQVPYTVGQQCMIGGSVVAAGALAYYGLGINSEMGIREKSVLWPAYVKQRVISIYQYVGGSLILTAGSAWACFNSPAVMRLVTSPSLGMFFGHAVLLIGSLWIMESIPYKEGLGPKQLAWAACCGLVGTIVAPICLMGGPAVGRALMTTAGAVAGLTTIALCAPDRKFLNWGGPLGLGLGAVFAANIVAPFTSPFSTFGASMHSMVIYGGLLLFSALLLYDTQKAVTKAETHPYYPYNGVQFDPINAAMSVYLDIIHIFMRLVIIQQGGKKK